MNHLEIVKMTLDKFGVVYHELQEEESTYIMPFGSKDKKGYIYIGKYGYELYPLTKSCQFKDFIEFYKGEIASY